MTRRLFLPIIALLALAFTGAWATRHAEAPSATPAHWSFGHGPVVVMVHGLGSRVDHWLPTARVLARDHRVVLVELPGHGISAMPDPLTLESATALLGDAIDDATPEPVILVGHSVGGVVAANFALAHPNRVRQLVLVETVLKPTFDPSQRRAIRAALDRDYNGTISEVYQTFGRDSAQGAALAAEVEQLDRHIVRAWVDLALDADLSTAVRGLRMPVLAVFATRNWDPSLRWDQVESDLGYAGIPNLTPARLTGCGHFVMLDRPVELAALIERAVASAAGPLALR
jgi:pimeloyl-ACP methyl ester carboxylesterase